MILKNSMLIEIIIDNSSNNYKRDDKSKRETGFYHSVFFVQSI